MADNTVTLSFNNDLFTDARGDTATYSGTIQVDYTTNSFSGNVKVMGQTRGFGAGFNFSGGLQTNGSAYIVAGNNFTLSYTGQQPTSAYAEFVLNNNEDYKTSLNNSGRQSQPISASGWTSSGTTGGGTTTGGGPSGGTTTGGGSTSSGGTGIGDVTATIAFTNDLFTDARGDKATYSGTIKVDYTTGTYSGSVKVNGRGLGAGIGLSGHLTASGSTYTINQSNFTFTYSGQTPTTANVEFKLNNNQDFRTSLNPVGQRNQPVSSTGNGTTTNAPRVEAASVASPTGDGGSPQQSPVSDTSTAFVFDPGHGHDLVRRFLATGSGHDTLSLASADFGNSIAEVLRDTRNSAGEAVITDPATHDTVRLVGVTKAQLVHDRGDSVLHG